MDTHFQGLEAVCLFSCSAAAIDTRISVWHLSLTKTRIPAGFNGCVSAPHEERFLING
ncbi:MAG: hypothetical protein WCG03_00660 [Kiritimatiellales bacterium]